MTDNIGDQMKDLERTAPEPDRESATPAEEHRAEGNLRRGLTDEQQREELHGDAANRRELRKQAERDNEKLRGS